MSPRTRRGGHFEAEIRRNRGVWGRFRPIFGPFRATFGLRRLDLGGLRRAEGLRGPGMELEGLERRVRRDDGGADVQVAGPRRLRRHHHQRRASRRRNIPFSLEERLETV